MSTSKATRRYRPTTEEFNETITSLIRDLHVFRQSVEFAATNSKSNIVLNVDTVGEVPFNKKFVSKLEDELRHRLLSLKRDFSSKKKPKTNSHGQFSKPFYISDQFRDFLVHANIGDEVKKSREFKIISKRGMATSGLLNSLLNAYHRLNSTKNDDKVYEYTKEMEKYFKTTDLVLGGKKLTTDNIPSGVPPERHSKLVERLKSSGPSVRKRLETDGYFENGGYRFQSVVKILNYFRIPSELLTAEQRADLESPEAMAATNTLSRLSSEATEASRSQVSA